MAKKKPQIKVTFSKELGKFLRASTRIRMIHGVHNGLGFAAENMAADLSRMIVRNAAQVISDKLVEEMMENRELLIQQNMVKVFTKLGKELANGRTKKRT